MNSRVFLTALLLGVSFVSAFAKPNILVVLSDDQGYADTGFQGAKDLSTPNLDRLAASGLRCTSGYVTHPFCSPSRAGLMAGRYQQRFGHEHNPSYNPADAKEGLPLTEKLLPEYLREAGYVTGWVGKWHLGATPAHHPLQRGFMETFGFIGGGHHFVDWEVKPTVEYNLAIEKNGQPVEVKDHLTLALGHEAAQFIQRHQAEPWFLYTAFNAPHVPPEPTSERQQRFSAIQDLTRRKYAAQLSLLDDGIGEMLDTLEASGQRDRTLIFFFSDNGGPFQVNGSINKPLRSGKGSVYEGGIRVPFVVSWPGTLPAGATYEQPISSLDVMATALPLAGVAMPNDKKYDGVNMLPFLKGEQTGSAHPDLFWRSDKHLAVREGDWKLVRLDDQPDELYNLAVDVSESRDQAAAQPTIAKRLAASLDAWNAELIPPAFPGTSNKAKAGRKPAGE